MADDIKISDRESVRANSMFTKTVFLPFNPLTFLPCNLFFRVFLVRSNQTLVG